MRLSIVRILLICIIFSVSEVWAQSWSKLVPASGAPPAPRQNASSIHNPINNSLVIFGGRNDGGNLNDVWSFNLDSLVWTNITPADTPQPAMRFAHTAVYDPINHSMIIWSGQGAGFYNDVWAFDLTTHIWQQRSPTGTIPMARYGSVAIYNPSAHRMTMFSGFTTSGRFDDTQAYDIALNNWIELTPSGTNPLQRCLHAACYDEQRHRMIIYGGQNAGPLDDIWAFDLTANTWSNLTPPTKPPGRIFPSSIYADNHVIVFGGLTASGNENTLWSFNMLDSSWTMITPSGILPEKRNSHAAVFIPQDRSMIVFAGEGDSLYNDVWKLSDIVTDNHEAQIIPQEFELYQNYPNPFNPATRIQYAVASTQHIRMRIYNTLGEVVATLVDEIQDVGFKSVEWNATGQASGVYFYTLQTPYLTKTQKMMLLR